MHRLERIQLVGFKSFVDRTEIQFNDGITCVIGPNGCGKSNIADAISWVLGEQSAKSLRGQHMGDVIFNGTATQKPSGYAEVSLSLKQVRCEPDLADPIEGDRIEVARRLYRSGESEYLLNGRKCRLKDIHEMFEGTGLGFSSYAIIEQERIGAILGAKPLERRSLIEEAARIVSFKHRRRAAELKLEMSQQNLLRIHDIMVEIERNLRSLKRQAAKARFFSKLRDRLRHQHQLLLAKEFRRLQDQLDQARAQLDEVLARDRDLVAQLERHDSQLRQQQLEARRLHEQLQQGREQLSRLALEIDRGAHLAQYQKEQQAATEKRLETSRLERLQLEENGQRLQQQLSRAEADCQAVALEVEELEGQLSERAESIDSLEQSVAEAENRMEMLRREALHDAAQAASLRNQHLQIEQALRDSDNRAGKLEQDCRRGQAEQLERAEHKSKLDAESYANRQRVASLRGQEAEATGREETLAGQLEQLRAQADVLQEKVVATQQRLHSLEELELRRANYSEGVQKFLNRAAGSSLRLSGTLADHVETDARYEPIVEELLNDELQYVLVDTMEEALKGLSFLKSERSGRATFLAIHSGPFSNGNGDWDQLSGQPGVIAPLETLLRMKQDVREAFRRALPHLAAAAVVSDVETALGLAARFPHRTFITLSGEQLSPRGLLTGVGESNPQGGLLSLKREKKELLQSTSQTRKQLTLVQQQLDGARSEHEQTRKQRHGLLQLLHEAEKQAVVLEHRLEAVTSEWNRALQELEIFAAEREHLRAQEDQLHEKVQAISSELSALEGRERERQTSFADTQRRIDDERKQMMALSQRRSEAHSAAAAKGEQLKHLTDGLTRLRQSLDETQNRLARLVEEVEYCRESIQQLEKSRDELSRREAGLHGQKHALEGQLVQLEAACGQCERSSEELAEQTATQRVARDRILEERSRFEIEKAHRESELEHVERTVREQYQQDIRVLWESLTVEASEKDDALVAAEYESLKTRAEQFGPINMTALEEYQEHEQRYQFLRAQRADIEASIADTTAAIQEINQRSRRQFMDAFTQVNAHFKEMFQVLFGGGECGMQLIDESDVLESGIDIYAQPPGKRLQNIMLLSGGEKALTAFALLLGLFQYRPSPFCLLDEVDAPLDDANVRRFTQLVQYMTEKAQFVIITHNKRTMEISHCLYGVTMEQPGISKVVSVNFNAPPKRRAQPEPVRV